MFHLKNLDLGQAGPSVRKTAYSPWDNSFKKEGSIDWTKDSCPDYQREIQWGEGSQQSG